jgi:hypothetical protein
MTSFPLAKVRKSGLRHDDRPEQIRFNLCAKIRHRRVFYGGEISVSSVVDDNVQRATATDRRFTAIAAAASSVTSSAKSLIWSPWRSERSRRDSMSWLSPTLYYPPQGPLRQSRGPARENCPSRTKLATFILLLFAIGSTVKLLALALRE